MIRALASGTATACILRLFSVKDGAELPLPRPGMTPEEVAAVQMLPALFPGVWEQDRFRVEEEASLVVWGQGLGLLASKGLEVAAEEDDYAKIALHGQPSLLWEAEASAAGVTLTGSATVGGHRLTRPVLELAAKAGWAPVDNRAWVPDDRAALVQFAPLVGPGRLVWPGGAETKAALASLAGVKVLPGAEAVLRRLAGVDGQATPPRVVFRGQLMAHQQDGVKWLLARWERGIGCVLADDMGVGKSCQVLAVISAILEKRSTMRALICCPKTLMENWAKEIAKFTPHFSVLVWNGPGNKRMNNEQYLLTEQVTLVSYPLLRDDRAIFESIDYDAVFCDEAQQIKNKDGILADVVRRLKSPWKVAVTGTPLENNLGELWNILDVVSPGLFGAWDEFKEAVVDPMREGDMGGYERFKSEVEPFMLRRKKEDTLRDMPPKEKVDFVCPMTPQQKLAYDQLYRETTDILAAKNSGRGNGGGLLAAVTRLRHMATDPRLGAGQDGGWTSEDSGKMNGLKHLLMNEILPNNGKVIIFSQWTQMLGFIRDELDQAGFSYCYLDGQTKDRGDQCELFQTRPDIPIFLVSLRAGGAGLNLFAANHVVLYDLWWNPAVEAQAESRAHRNGQTRPVTVWRMLSQGTIEERIAMLQSAKGSLADGVIDDGDGPSEEELQALFTLCLQTSSRVLLMGTCLSRTSRRFAPSVPRSRLAACTSPGRERWRTTGSSWWTISWAEPG